MTRHPNLYIIAGPNGAGKTTFAEEFLQNYAECRTFINADTIARGLAGFSPDAVALKAGRLLLEQIGLYADKKIDFAFETTLSGVTHLSRLKDMKKESYRIHLFFLWIPDIRLSLERVAHRIKMGGHGVSEKVVRRRFHRGIKNFFKIYRSILDSWMLFDNSRVIPHVIAEEEDGKVKIFDHKLYERVLAFEEAK